ncbi:Inner membrane protein yjgN [Streptococcus pneumoniae]|nr:Inner membrane protein yjgN [Streptococcus pneumoniae]
MAQVINDMDVPSHSFVFHGTGERYFLICVVNVLLTIITLGIYLPWALMKCKRYLYANMEVNGQRFSGNDSNLLIVFYVQIMPDDFVMQLHRF